MLSLDTVSYQRIRPAVSPQQNLNTMAKTNLEPDAWPRLLEHKQARPAHNNGAHAGAIRVEGPPAMSAAGTPDLPTSPPQWPGGRWGAPYSKIDTNWL